MLKSDEWVLKVIGVKSVVAVVFCPSACWMFSIAILDFLNRYELWWSQNNAWGRPSKLVGIVLTPDSLFGCVMDKCDHVKDAEEKMSTGNLHVTMYMSRSVHPQLLSVIVGKFAGWLMYFPALPNCVLMFQNSTGGSSTASLMLHDHVFLVAWFSMCR